MQTQCGQAPVITAGIGGAHSMEKKGSDESEYKSDECGEESLSSQPVTLLI